MASILVDHSTSNLTGYSVQEDATPLNPADTTGGVGQVDFSVPAVSGPEGSVQLTGLDVRVSDRYRGTTTATVNEVHVADGIASVSADGRLNSLIGTITARPMVDTLQAVVNYYLSLAGISDNVFIDSSVAFRPVAVPGFNDDLWLRLKQLVSVHGCEVALVGNKIVVRPVRSFKSDTKRKTDFSWGVAKGDAAQFVEATYYGNTWISQSIVYPYTDDERDNAHVWEVPAGTTVEDDISLSVSLATIVQPTIQAGVPSNYGQYDPETDSIVGAPVTSVYSVYGLDNSLVTPQNWTSQGGKFEVSINPDTTSVHVKITAPNDESLSPYRIVGRSTNTPDPEDYPSFFLVGTGVYTNAQVLRLPTGVAPSTSVNVVGDTAEIAAVATLDDAYNTGLILAKAWSGTELSVSGTLTSINRVSDTGTYNYPDFASFNAEQGTSKFSDFDAAWSSKTFKEFDQVEYAKVEDTFENQTFGNVAGARLRHEDAMYRITNATISDQDITFDAIEDTVMGDFSTEFAGKTISDFNDLFAGKSFRQFGRIPLNSVPSTGEIYVPPTGTDPYPDTFYPDQLYPA